jgi:capsular exopolysaccharide synthesis family protein
MDLADHIRTIAANWWRILLIAALFGAAAFTFSKTRDKTYECSTLVTVAAAEARHNDIPFGPDQLAFRVALYSNFLKSPAVANAAVKAGNLGQYGLDGYSVANRLSDFEIPIAGLIQVKATATSVKEACAIAAAYAQGLVDVGVQQANADATSQRNILQAQIDKIDVVLKDATLAPAAKTQLETTRQTLAVQQANIQVNTTTPVAVLSPATPTDNGAPIAPRPSRDGLLVFLAVLVITAEAFVIARAFSDRVSRTFDVEAITELTGLPVLAMVPKGRGPEVVEAFRTLRTNLMFLEGSGRPRTIAIVSPNPGAGKSFCSTHLAESAVAVDASVVLIDADLRRPVLHQRLRVEREPGLSDVLRGGPLADALHRVDGYANLQLIPSGSPVSDTVAILGGHAFRNVLESLDSAELIIVDTPPGAGYSDALAVSASCDATLLVLDSETTRRRSTTQFIEALERTGASLIGVVLNGAVVHRRDTYERA